MQVTENNILFRKYVNCLFLMLIEARSRSSRKRPPREFRKVVTTRAGRLQEWALVSDHVIKQ